MKDVKYDEKRICDSEELVYYLFHYRDFEQSAINN